MSLVAVGHQSTDISSNPGSRSYLDNLYPLRENERSKAQDAPLRSNLRYWLSSAGQPGAARSGDIGARATRSESFAAVVAYLSPQAGNSSRSRVCVAAQGGRVVASLETTLCWCCRQFNRVRRLLLSQFEACISTKLYQ